jgi:predicted flap endonuclease-1-like 5' DNA nuclease
MSFITAVIGSILFLLGAAILGGIIVWTIMRRRWGILFGEYNVLKSQYETLQATQRKKDRECEVEVAARERKLDVLRHEYDGYRATAEQRYTELSNNIEATNNAFASSTAMANERYKELVSEMEAAQRESEVREQEMLAQITLGAQNYAELRAKLDQAQHDAANREAQFNTDLGQLRATNTTLLADNEALRQKLAGQAQLVGELDRLKTAHHKLQGDLSGLADQMAGHQGTAGELAQLKSAHARLQADYDALLAKLNSQADPQALQAQLASLQADYLALQDQAAQKNQEMNALLRERDEQVSRLNLAIGEMRLGTTMHGGAAMSSPNGPGTDKKEQALAKVRAKARNFDYSNIGMATYADRDDLKIIVGIGPFIEEKLFALDIYTFEQISRFNDHDIAQVTAAIEFFPGRIERDHWVSQAAELAQQKRQKPAEHVG